MKRMIQFVVAVFVLFALLGCSMVKMVTPVNTSSPELAVSMDVDKTSQGFILKMKNISTSDVTIEWGKSMYIHPSGGRETGFTYGTESSAEEGSHATKDLTIRAGETVTRSVYPISTRYCSRSTCKWGFLPAGKSGMDLVYRIEGKSKSLSLECDLK